MLLNTLEHLAYRVAGLSLVIYTAEKTNLINNFVSGNDNEAMVALKTSALLSGSEYLSDQLLSTVTNVKVPSLYNTISQFGITFVVNALIIYAMDKLQLDEIILKRGSSQEMKAVQFGIFFVIVQEISYRLIHMYLSKY